MESFTNLDQSVVPRGVISIGKDLESNMELLHNLQMIQKSLETHRLDVEKTVKVSFDIL